MGPSHCILQCLSCRLNMQTGDSGVFDLLGQVSSTSKKHAMHPHYSMMQGPAASMMDCNSKPKAKYQPLLTMGQQTLLHKPLSNS